MAGAVAGSAVSMTIGILTGFGGAMVTIPQDRTIITAALIDRRGKIIWYNYFMQRDDRSLTKPDDARYVIDELLSTCRHPSGGDL
jgi:phosphatidylglycerophosphatase A